MPTISVIVPVYKVEPYLARCVDSILAQTFQDFELILVDDGSPDNCGAICDEYARKDSRVYVIHQENGGLSAARNAGLDWMYANSDGQWITFIDSDDWVHRDYLKAMLSAVEQFGVTQVMCNDISTDVFVEDRELPTNMVTVVDAEQAYIDYYGLCMTACDKMIHRSIMENIRFPVGKLHEDAYVTHLMTFASERIAVCTFPLYYYFTNPGSITRVKWTEDRLQEFDGHEVRLQYLQEHGYQEAYIAELEAYTLTVFSQLQDLTLLSKQEPKYRGHRKALRARALPLFRKARKYGLFPAPNGYYWMYELAYPVKPIWIIRNIINRTKQR